MSVTLPSSVDAWREVRARRSFQGSLPVSAFARLGEVVASPEGDVTYELDFGRDEFNIAYVAVRAKAPLTVICQRSLEPFVLSVEIDTRLGLIVEESEEAALPPGYEALLIEQDGKLSLVATIEDELLLALPLVPVNPDYELPDDIVGADEEEEASPDPSENPFAALRGLIK
ncbi:DNA-binding protein [Luteibacter rhizovicinus DSM 16549]|uniref:Large ribosomal RNA subunit accumulation protein YceD n=1 Tax=Luteibacter rhizovicinus DSM 16549 TaxID=1440763 RepID=A0A0G9H890_9GAMM|nr:YceD family protein [Luteibacter rhizovicinus]APG06221.1 DNA-binding protein [Luteibacter rhizovicinus DSM 16549]KLD65641.1 DNA-binding protein [Luteibacter rhizovicinus DSM 16549]KLD75617.1 DNA-binding protein [Xanthomonas hyacinthi DSM 19077]